MCSKYYKSSQNILLKYLEANLTFILIRGLGPIVRGWPSIRWAGGMLIFVWSAGWASPWNNTHLSSFLYLFHPYSTHLSVDATISCDNMIRKNLPASVTLFSLLVSCVLSFGLSRFTSLSLHLFDVFFFSTLCSFHRCPIFTPRSRFPKLWDFQPVKTDFVNSYPSS